MQHLRPYIIYLLSKEKTNQAIKGRKIEHVWENVCQFLQACTSVSPDSPDYISLTAFTAYDINDPKNELEEIVERTNEKFGTGIISPIAYNYPSGKPHETNKIDWKIENDQIDDVVDFLIKGQPWPKSTFGPIQAFISYSFNLQDPDNRKELENQDEKSDFYIWLGRKSSCCPTLHFPFEKPDSDFWTYFNKLATFAPFKLDRKFLREVKANKTGTNLVYRKLASG